MQKHQLVIADFEHVAPVTVGTVPVFEKETPMSKSMSTVPTNHVMSKEDTMHKITRPHLSIEEMFKNVSTNKEKEEIVHTSIDLNTRSLMYRIGDNYQAMFRQIDAYNKRIAEQELAEEERAQKRVIESNLEETERMIRTFFGRKFNQDDLFEGPSLSTNKSARRELNMAWRVKVKSIYEVIAFFDAVAKEEKHKVDKAFTQSKQAEAQAKVVEQARIKKEEKQARHQRKVAKMEAKKLEGKTPKQVKRTKRSTCVPVVTIPNVVMSFGIKSIMGSVSFQCTATTKKGEQCKNKSKELAHKTCSSHNNKEV